MKIYVIITTLLKFILLNDMFVKDTKFGLLGCKANSNKDVIARLKLIKDKERTRTTYINTLND